MSTEEGRLETRCLSSLSKVFADQELTAESYTSGSALINETYSFQIAFRTIELMNSIQLQIHSSLEEQISIYSVGLAPSELPCYSDHDEQVLRSTPGLYPDPLYPLNTTNGELKGFPNQWRSVWITVDLNERIKSGMHPIRIMFVTNSGEELGEESFVLEVIDALLPKQKLIHTEWFHSDCLATYYQDTVFSSGHWKRIDQYIQTAVKHGMNMILTPLFTPPLDTAIGGERPTVQLVDVVKQGQSYTFGFERLERWVELCNCRGIEYFEFAHFFTQWGAKHAPKIIANVDGQDRQIFGWDTDASGDEYASFLTQFLPQLKDFIEVYKLGARSYFHVSDEPHMDHLESYQHASQIIYKFLGEYPVIDAISDYEFYEKGIVKHPIPANNHIGPFIEHDVPNLWTYYCCMQYKEVSNRFFNMPSARNRVIALQLYKFNIKGFLHWGYNFWNSQYSTRAIDPYKITDSGGAFPSGDAFLVYPGEEGPIESIRLKVFAEALQDLRAFQCLEQYIGREKVLDMLQEELVEPISFSKYPHSKQWLLSIREKVNNKIKEHITNEKE